MFHKESIGEEQCMYIPRCKFPGANVQIFKLK